MSLLIILTNIERYQKIDTFQCQYPHLEQTALFDCIFFKHKTYSPWNTIKRTTYQARKITNKFLVTEVNYLFAPASTPSVLSVTC